MKKCIACGLEKDTSDFYRHRKAFHSRCKTCLKQYMSVPGRRTAAAAKYYQTHKKIINEKGKKRYRENVQARLAKLLRDRFQQAVKKAFKQTSCLNLLGCNMAAFRERFESLFLPGMTWENQGKWHIDHIIPCSAFDLTIFEEQKKCFHYTNLQPLWAKDNMSKGDKTAYQLLLLGSAQSPSSSVGYKASSADSS